MQLTQALNGSVNAGTSPTYSTTGTLLGFNSNQIILGLILLAIVLLAVWWAFGTRDRYYYRGTKGGRARRVITEEYDDDDVVDDELL